MTNLYNNNVKISYKFRLIYTIYFPYMVACVIVNINDNYDNNEC